MNTSNSLGVNSTYDLLKKGLDASSARSRVIANNIANLNTKGYKRYYVSFEDQLKDTKDQFELSTTNAKHINDNSNTELIQTKQDTSSSMREDGNNVDVDHEMADQAANQLMYNALISQVNSRLSLERYIIKEGKG